MKYVWGKTLYHKSPYEVQCHGPCVFHVYKSPNLPQAMRNDKRDYETPVKTFKHLNDAIAWAKKQAEK